MLRSPEPSRAQHSGGGSYSSNNGKRKFSSIAYHQNLIISSSLPFFRSGFSDDKTVSADLRSLAATASGLYPDNGFGSNGAYGSHSAATNGGGYYSSAPQNSAYGPVYYAQPNALATDSYEMRKRATYDALNEFFGDVKKRQIDPSVYYDVGQRLMGIQGVQLPMLSGGYHGGNDYSGGPGVATAHAPVHQTQYQLPLPNLRTKNDLVNIDQFLEALQSTVYENPNQAAAAGVQQAGAHYLHPQVGYRSSNSPPGSTHGHIGSSHASAMASMSAPATDTPALTPASSVLSYTSGHSPGSVGSGNTISPTTRSNMGSMYPTLPSVSAMDVSGNYTATSNAPSSSLGTSFDAEGRRRYSGPLLQKARRSSDQMDLSEDSLSPKEDSRRGSVDTTRLTAVDPALGGLKSPGSSSSHDVADRDQETWVENIRTIEQLREYIKHRLEQGDFMDEDEEMKDDKSAMDDAQSLYPVLRAVQDD